jgi:hypothetical protein
MDIDYQGVSEHLRKARRAIAPQSSSQDSVLDCALFKLQMYCQAKAKQQGTPLEHPIDSSDLLDEKMVKEVEAFV